MGSTSVTDEMQGRGVGQNSTLCELGCDLPAATPRGSDDGDIHGGHATDLAPSPRHRSFKESNSEGQRLDYQGKFDCNRSGDHLIRDSAQVGNTT